MSDCAPPATGQLISSNLYDVVAISPQDPRNAAARALRAFLENLTFSLSGVGKAADKRFSLKRVTMEWPDSHDEITYPSASIVELPGEYQGHNLSPSPLEDTWNVFERDTVLWKTAELVVDFQVDFWTMDNPTREAIAATLPVVFAPHEGQASIAVYSAPEYFSRPVRLMLTKQERSDDSEMSLTRTKRLKVTIAATIEAVHLRRVAPIQPSTSFEITDIS
jgi:hypothetical protein